MSDLEKQLNNFIRLHPSYRPLRDDILQDLILEHLERSHNPQKKHLSKSAKSIFSCVKQRYVRQKRKERDFLYRIETITRAA